MSFHKKPGWTSGKEDREDETEVKTAKIKDSEIESKRENLNSTRSYGFVLAADCISFSRITRFKVKKIIGRFWIKIDGETYICDFFI
jgi:hypothetical protein